MKLRFTVGTLSHFIHLYPKPAFLGGMGGVPHGIWDLSSTRDQTWTPCSGSTVREVPKPALFNDCFIITLSCARSLLFFCLGSIFLFRLHYLPSGFSVPHTSNVSSVVNLDPLLTQPSKPSQPKFTDSSVLTLKHRYHVQSRWNTCCCPHTKIQTSCPVKMEYLLLP